MKDDKEILAILKNEKDGVISIAEAQRFTGVSGKVLANILKNWKKKGIKIEEAV